MTPKRTIFSCLLRNVKSGIRWLVTVMQETEDAYVVRVKDGPALHFPKADWERDQV